MSRREGTVTYVWRGEFENVEVERLHAEAFGHAVTEYDWQGQLQWSLGWVTARSDKRLVGFVNVAWDGGLTPSFWTPWWRPANGMAESPRN